MRHIISNITTSIMVFFFFSILMRRGSISVDAKLWSKSWRRTFFWHWCYPQSCRKEPRWMVASQVRQWWNVFSSCNNNWNGLHTMPEYTHDHMTLKSPKISSAGFHIITTDRSAIHPSHFAQIYVGPRPPTKYSPTHARRSLFKGLSHLHGF